MGSQTPLLLFGCPTLLSRVRKVVVFSQYLRYFPSGPVSGEKAGRVPWPSHGPCSVYEVLSHVRRELLHRRSLRNEPGDRGGPFSSLPLRSRPLPTVHKARGGSLQGSGGPVLWGCRCKDFSSTLRVQCEDGSFFTFSVVEVLSQRVKGGSGPPSSLPGTSRDPRPPGSRV